MSGLSRSEYALAARRERNRCHQRAAKAWQEPALLAVYAARARSGRSFTRSLARALDEAITRGAAERAPPPPLAAAEFDELFGGQP